MRMTKRSLRPGLALCLGSFLAFAGNPAKAEPRSPPSVADFARLEGDLARVQQELRDQRQLILQLMQMHDALLKYVQLGGGVPPTTAGPRPAVGGAEATAAGAGVAGGLARDPGAVDGAAAGGARASITGRIHGAAAAGEAYVYLDGPRTLLAHPPTIEIKQQGRQFVPAVAVVQVGGRISFPNEDRVFHNVFSRTPGDAFDLGTLKAGDKPNPVVLLKPGHVEVFCNIHSKMRADILVVPNNHWARVRPDGSFQLQAVPVGSHSLVLWGPAIKPSAQHVEVTPAGANVSFSADAASHPPHLNKQGVAYESYEN